MHGIAGLLKANFTKNCLLAEIDSKTFRCKILYSVKLALPVFSFRSHGLLPKHGELSGRFQIIEPIQPKFLLVCMVIGFQQQEFGFLSI